MPWRVARTSQCPTSKPFGVINAQTHKVVPGGCHATRSGAERHQRALYANVQDREGAPMSRNQIPWRTTRRMFALHSRGNDWYRIKNQLEGPTQLHIYDEIGYFGVSASDLIRDLADVNGPLEVHLNSPGGEVDDGVAIYNTLSSRRDVTIIIDGLAASIASVIAMAGNPILIARQGKMMVHDGYAMAIGNAQDLRDLAEHLDRTSNNIAQIYAEHTGHKTEYWRQIMQTETWYYGQEAIDAGLADRFVTSGAGRQTTDPDWDLSVFRNAADAPPKRQRRSSEGHGQQPTDGPGQGHDPDNDPDDPDKPDHDADDDHRHRHDDDDDQNSQQIVVYNLDGSVQILNWDAAAAYSKCHSASDFKSIAFEKSNDSDPNTSAHYGLPHHSSPGSGPDKGGVVAALGRANQVEGLKNKSAAISHLKAHARSLGLPSGDGDGNLDTSTQIWDSLTDDQILAALKGA